MILSDQYYWTLRTKLLSCIDKHSVNWFKEVTHESGSPKLKIYTTKVVYLWHWEFQNDFKKTSSLQYNLHKGSWATQQSNNWIQKDFEQLYPKKYQFIFLSIGWEDNWGILTAQRF